MPLRASPLSINKEERNLFPGNLFIGFSSQYPLGYCKSFQICLQLGKYFNKTKTKNSEWGFNYLATLSKQKIEGEKYVNVDFQRSLFFV